MEPSDFIVYADESGDHSLAKINASYPVFVLALCVYRKEDYCTSSSPALQRLKFKHWGHDMVVLHERKIKQAEGSFAFLVDAARRADFMTDLDDLMTAQPMTVIAAVIDKSKHVARYGAYAANPYTLGLGFCLERLYYYLNERGQADRATVVVFEGRGKVEDDELELAFRRTCAANGTGNRLPFGIVIAPKTVNSSGLQIADLIARPIGRHVIAPAQPNRAFDIIKTKMRTYYGRIHGAGLKIFP
jgi:hypothetical protein